MFLDADDSTDVAGVVQILKHFLKSDVDASVITRCLPLAPCRPLPPATDVAALVPINVRAVPGPIDGETAARGLAPETTLAPTNAICVAHKADAPANRAVINTLVAFETACGEQRGGRGFKRLPPTRRSVYANSKVDREAMADMSKDELVDTLAIAGKEIQYLKATGDFARKLREIKRVHCSTPVQRLHDKKEELDALHAKVYMRNGIRIVSLVDGYSMAKIGRHNGPATHQQRLWSPCLPGNHGKGP